jgi:glyoxylase-like metal-dependent hydrolase (beta-lactamase superfamily II)
MENPFAPRTYGRLEKVTDRVWLFRNVVNSSVVLGERGVAVIDTQVNLPMARRLLAAIRSVTDEPILYAINTHYHLDHTTGNAVFAAEGAQVIASRATKAFMTGRAPRQKAFLASRGFELGPDPHLPETTFENSLDLDLGGQRLLLRHLGKAETDDATAIHLPDERLVVSGDTVMTGSFPIFGQPVMNEGLMSSAWLDTIAAIKELAPEAILPGHGPLARATEVELLERIERWFLEEVAAAHARGTTDPLELCRELEPRLPAWMREIPEVWGTPRYAILRVWRGLAKDEKEPGWQHRKPSAVTFEYGDSTAARAASLATVEGIAAAAREALEGGDAALALGLAKEAVMQHHSDARAFVLWGRLLIECSRSAASVLEKGDFFKLAHDAALRARELDPDHAPGWLLEGQMRVMVAFRNGDDTAPGEAAVRHALELGLDAKDQGMAKFLLGLASRTQGDEPAAKRYFGEAVALDPALFPARLALAG